MRRLASPIYPVLRWLLRLDAPLPPPDDHAAERHFRWNFFFNSLDVSFFMTGVSFLSATTILPLFISKLTGGAANTLALALLAMIAQGGWYLPQLLTANAVERVPRKKPILVNLGFFTERLPALFLVLTPFVATRSPATAVILLLLFFAWRELGGGVIATAWQDFIARLFPVEWRGRFLGLNMFIGTGLGVAAARASAWLLETFPFPLNFAYIFGAAATLHTLSWLALSMAREPIAPVTRPRRSTRQYLAALPAVVRADVNFRRFLSARVVLALAEMGTGFLTVAAIQRWAISDATVATYTAAALLGQTAANLGAGFLADRRGHKLPLELTGVAIALAFGVAWLAPSPGWMVVVFFLQGASLGARIVAGVLVVLEFSPNDQRPTYTGLANTLVGLASIGGPLLGALLALRGFDLLFAAGAFTGLLAFAMLRFGVREPRRELTSE